MSINKEISDKDLEQVNGGFSFMDNNQSGYWYKVVSDGKPYRRIDEQYGIATAAERDMLLAGVVQKVKAEGRTILDQSSGYIGGAISC